VDPKTLKLLVVEDDLEDEQLLCEALIEIEENRLWFTWPAASIVQVDQLADALECLARDRFDAVLLNLSLPDSPVLLDTFLDVRLALETEAGSDEAPAVETPLIALLDEPDENLANRLVREGAQDVLVKNELECAALARSVRYAIERQRRVAPQCAALNDALTGTLARAGFFTIADSYVQLGIQQGAALLAGRIELTDEATGGVAEDDRQSLDLVMLRAGEVLRAEFPPPTLLGRISRGAFGLITAGLAQTLVEAQLHRVGVEIESAGWAIRRPVIARFQTFAVRSPEDLGQAFVKTPVVAARNTAKTAILTD